MQREHNMKIDLKSPISPKKKPNPKLSKDQIKNSPTRINESGKSFP